MLALWQPIAIYDCMTDRPPAKMRTSTNSQRGAKGKEAYKRCGQPRKAAHSRASHRLPASAKQCPTKAAEVERRPLSRLSMSTSCSAQVNEKASLCRRPSNAPRLPALPTDVRAIKLAPTPTLTLALALTLTLTLILTLGPNPRPRTSRPRVSLGRPPASPRLGSCSSKDRRSSSQSRR